MLGLTTSRGSTPVEGDDAYTSSKLGGLYGDKQTQQSQTQQTQLWLMAAQMQKS